MLHSAAQTIRPHPVPPDEALMLGVEQEFDLFSPQGQLDFRALFSQVTRSQRHILFRNCDGAAILDAGYMLACDGQEAEFATAPIRAHGDGCLRLAREVTRCRAHLLGLLARAGVPQVRGFSTHLSISVPPGREWEMASALSRTVGPALALLMESRESPGLLIRPRRGRLEIGSEYIDREEQLAAASVFLSGAVRAFLFDPRLWEEFPRPDLKRWEEANIRPGIYLPHDAYGGSVHEQGREAALELEGGGRIRAGELLELSSRLSLQCLEGIIDPRAAEALRAAVWQAGSLQIERPKDPGLVGEPQRSLPAAPEAGLLRSLVLAQSRLGLTPRFVDWEGAAFSWKGNAPQVIGVPWEGLPALFETARSRQLPRFVDSLGPQQARLSALDQLGSPGVFQSLDAAALGHQALSDKGRGKGKDGGPSKPPKHHEPVPYIVPRPASAEPSQWTRWLLTVLILITTGIAIIGIRERRSIQPVPPTPTATPTAAYRSTAPLPSRSIPSRSSTPTLSHTPTFTPTETATATSTPTPTRRPLPTWTRTRRAPPKPTSCDPATGTCGGSGPPPTCDPATGICG